MRRRRWRWWLGVPLLLVVLLVAAAAVAVARFDPESLRAPLADAVASATGRTLTIAGPIRLRPSLYPTLEVNDVQLANLPGGSRPDIAHAERIEAQISLLALLQRRLDIAHLLLVGPNILFEQVGGAPNWIFTAPGDADAPQPPPPSSPATQGFTLRIRHLVVQNGMVTWKLPARTKVVGIRSLTLDHPVDGGVLRVGSTLVYSDNQPFRLDLVANPTGAPRDPWRVQLDFAAFDTTATATGTADVAGLYDLQVDGTAGALEKLNALLPEMRLPPVHGLAVSTHLGNGKQPGDLPVVGATHLTFASADLGAQLPGLALGATDVTLAAPGGQAKLTGAGSYAGTPFTLRSAFGVPTHPDGPATIPVDLAVAAQKVAATFSLTGKLSLRTLVFAGLDAATRLQTPALAGLRPVLGDRLPALTDVDFQGQVALGAATVPLRLSNARLATAQGDLRGDGQLAFAPQVAMTGTWQSDHMDLDALLDAFGIDLTPPAQRDAATGPMIPATPVPLSSLAGPTVKLRGSAAALRFAGEDWRDVQLAMELAGGHLQVGPVKAVSPAGPLQFALDADGARRPGYLAFTLQAPAMPLAQVLRYAGVPSAGAAGTVRLDAQLRASGATARAMAATLDGTVTAVAVNGTLSNAAAKEIAGPALDALGIDVPASGQTALRCLGLAGTFARGVGTFRTIALETTYLALEGVGQVDLGRETLAFKLSPMAALAGSQVAVPVVVEGSFRAPKGRLDASGLQQLGLFVDALFGGDTSTACRDAGLTK